MFQDGVGGHPKSWNKGYLIPHCFLQPEGFTWQTLDSLCLQPPGPEVSVLRGRKGSSVLRLGPPHWKRPEKSASRQQERGLGKLDK